MGKTKRFFFEKNINTISDIFKAIGHPALLQVLTFLLEKNNVLLAK